MQDIEVISDPAAAVAALDPVRARLLAELREPASAAGLADRVGLSRQKVGYHLRILQGRGLIAPAGTRRWGGLTERLVMATAEAYIVSPAALGEGAADPRRRRDQLSASYLISLAARIVREVGGMAARAAERDVRLPVMGLDTAIRFRSPDERAAFAAELAQAVAHLAGRYHDAEAPDGRWQRVLVGMHPVPADADPTEGHPRAAAPDEHDRTDQHRTEDP